ncbi:MULTISPECIES: DUF6456 domain-containing protein [Phyllobacterium]|jgi:hypothetical protein|uniref:DUF6456 domain-containing protein n=1 Tax=Phyllobacterium sophorae TaxID=1520277 RepID=A0A2P7B4J4_9HYPH|nr:MULTISPECIES: DUF6456 domain-containing protein [Phyllobacterium]PSH61395.1 hypothetical protein CU103_23860 [Phyllobacterium sophorae]UXN63436.1 DUF6456 domain-containing protein [Phyllobacterium sp. A18/5-2]
MTASQRNGANPAMTRLLRFLAKGPVRIAEQANREKLMLESGAYGSISIERVAVKSVISDGLGVLRNQSLVISDAGRAHLRRLECADDAYAAQHRHISTTAIAHENGLTPVCINNAESPLAMLRRRKDASGRQLISDDAFTAGERLRSDYTLGNLMPSIGVDWDVTGSGTRANGVLEITNAALAARQRVERALEAVGPELSGVLVDVCCFLKGLEAIERERQWPVRSAKLILKTALAALDRHYNPAPPARRKARIIHWGTEDYRPQIGS